MTHEVPQIPRRETIYPRTAENYPQSGLFNVAAMPDEYIIMIGRSLDRHHMSHEDSWTVEEEITVVESMAHLGADIAHLAMTNPERGRALMSRLAESDNVHERNLAGSAAVPLAFRGDHEFARDILLTAHTRYLAEGARGDLSLAHVTELEEVLTPIQPDLANDFSGRVYDLQTRAGWAP